jgi:hypothetical protein
MELQAGTCFYCGSKLENTVEVDHFLAWSRWPNDAIENLVAADRCNSAKSDHLAAASHVSRWSTRLQTQGPDLSSLAGSSAWESDAERTVGLARSTYGHLAPGTPLWVVGKEFETALGPLVV